MKRTLLVLVVAACLVSAAVPARAQFGPAGGATEVTQLLNHAELLATVAALADQIRRMDTNLLALAGVAFTDRYDFFALLNQLAGKSPLNYASPGAAEFYSEAMPSYLAFTPEVLTIINAPEFTRLWQSTVLNTFSGNLAAAVEQGALETVAESDRAVLAQRLGTAKGNLAALQLMGEAQLHTAQEISRLNQLLAGIQSNQAAFYGQTLANRGTREATERFLMNEAVASLPAPNRLNVYDDLQGFTGLPTGVN